MLAIVGFKPLPLLQGKVGMGVTKNTVVKLKKTGSSDLSVVTKSETSGAGQECPAYRLFD